MEEMCSKYIIDLYRHPGFQKAHREDRALEFSYLLKIAVFIRWKGCARVQILSVPQRVVDVVKVFPSCASRRWESVGGLKSCLAVGQSPLH